MPQEWKESIIVPIHNKGDKMNYNKYRGISLLSSLYNIPLARMTSYVEEITGEYQCGFRRTRSIVDHTFSIRQILVKKWEYNNKVCQLFMDF